jgi:hypothetical protein
MSFTVAWFAEIARAAWSMAVSWMVWRERKESSCVYNKDEPCDLNGTSYGL